MNYEIARSSSFPFGNLGMIDFEYDSCLMIGRLTFWTGMVVGGLEGVVSFYFL